MKKETGNQETRAAFYGSESVAKYIKANGVPASKHAFREMVASNSSESLEGKKGDERIACLNEVVFFKHPQQVNIMDKTNGQLIAVITT
jgi:hypothetical protein